MNDSKPSNLNLMTQESFDNYSRHQSLDNIS